jgi:predicted alpha/beta hydrolase family esterase
MRKVILFHGTTNAAEYYGREYPSLSNSHWFPWVQKELLIHKVEAHTPEIFEAFKPSYDKWLRELRRYDIDEQTSLVGHSCGGGFLVRWLSENKNARVDKVILVAPWINTDHVRKTDMFDFELDPNFADRATRAIVYYSDNDMPTIKKTIKKLKSDIPGLEFKEFKGYGHFTEGSLGKEFPELLEELLK